MLIQPSSRRAYTMREYQKAGAVISDDLSEAGTIVGELSHYHGPLGIILIFQSFQMPSVCLVRPK